MNNKVAEQIINCAERAVLENINDEELDSEMINRQSSADLKGNCRVNQQPQSTESELHNGITPWGHSVDGEKLASTVRMTFNRYTILPEGGDIALTLWTMLTYCFNALEYYPRSAFPLQRNVVVKQRRWKC